MSHWNKFAMNIRRRRRWKKYLPQSTLGFWSPNERESNYDLNYNRFLSTASVPGICDKYSALPLNRLLISFPLPTLNFAASFNFQTFHSQSSEYIRVFIQISQLEVTWHKYFSAAHIFCLLSQFSQTFNLKFCSWVWISKCCCRVWFSKFLLQ